MKDHPDSFRLLLFQEAHSWWLTFGSDHIKKGFVHAKKRKVEVGSRRYELLWPLNENLSFFFFVCYNIWRRQLNSVKDQKRFVRTILCHFLKNTTKFQKAIPKQIKINIEQILKACRRLGDLLYENDDNRSRNNVLLHINYTIVLDTESILKIFLCSPCEV